MIALDAFSLLVGALGASGLRLRLLRLWPRARLPWVPPAATGETCWNLASLTDFCNQHEDRTHPANDRPSLEAAFPSLPSRRCNVVPVLGLPFEGQHCSDGERRVSEAEAPARRRSAGCAGRIRSSQRARCGAAAHSGSSERLSRHRLDLPGGWDPREDRADQGPLPTSRANGTGLRKSLRRLPLPESRCRELILRGRQPSATRGRRPDWTRLFSRPRPDCLDGHDRSRPTANHPRRTG